jgi:hypothetical protein
VGARCVIDDVTYEPPSSQQHPAPCPPNPAFAFHPPGFAFQPPGFAFQPPGLAFHPPGFAFHPPGLATNMSAKKTWFGCALNPWARSSAARRTTLRPCGNLGSCTLISPGTLSLSTAIGVIPKNAPIANWPSCETSNSSARNAYGLAPDVKSTSPHGLPVAGGSCSSMAIRAVLLVNAPNSGQGARVSSSKASCSLADT